MVDADARVALERAAPIIPEAVNSFIGMEMADRVGPALIQNAPEGGPGVGRKQRVVLPILGLVDVEVGRDDILVAARDHRRLQVEQRFEMRVETRHPLELVIIFGARPRVAIG